MFCLCSFIFLLSFFFSVQFSSFCSRGVYVDFSLHKKDEKGRCCDHCFPNFRFNGPELYTALVCCLAVVSFGGP